MSGEAGAIERALAAAGHGGSVVHRFETLGSTSRWLEQGLGADAPAAVELCVTRHQSEGSGRRGRGWRSVPGDLTFSLLERLPLAPAALGGLSLVTGIAVAEALGERCGIEVRLKWPNDLLVDGAKLGGLLTSVHRVGRAATDAAGPSAVLSGIGINRVDDAARAAGGGIASLGALGVIADDREALVGALAVAVLDAHANFVDAGWSVFSERWRALDHLAGREIRVLGETRHETGLALGVAEDGALRVRVAGEERRVYGGEVSVRAIAGRDTV